MKPSHLSLAAASVLAFLVGSCSTSSNNNNNDGGNVGACTDMTGSATPAVTVVGSGGAYPSYSFSPACVQINKGQSVTFSANFTLHPIERTTQSVAGAANPLPTTPYSGASPVVYGPFTASGDFGLECTVHLFTGTVRVNP